MSLGDLRTGLALKPAEVAQRMGISLAALTALEGMRLDRVSVGTLRGYVRAIGAGLVLKHADGRTVQL